MKTLSEFDLLDVQSRMAVNNSLDFVLDNLDACGIILDIEQCDPIRQAISQVINEQRKSHESR